MALPVALLAPEGGVDRFSMSGPPSVGDFLVIFRFLAAVSSTREHEKEASVLLGVTFAMKVS